MGMSVFDSSGLYTLYSCLNLIELFVKAQRPFNFSRYKKYHVFLTTHSLLLIMEVGVGENNNNKQQQCNTEWVGGQADSWK